MRIVSAVLISSLVTFTCLAQNALAQNFGSPPQLSLDAANIYTAFAVALEDQPGSVTAVAAAQLQMGMRARSLAIGNRSATDAWTAAQTLLTPPLTLPGPAAASVSFSGSTASALNAFLQNAAAPYVRITSAAIAVDQPIVFAHDATTLDFGTAQLSAAGSVPYMIRIVGAQNVAILGGNFNQGNSAILIAKSTGVLVDHARMSGLTGQGIVITGSAHAYVTHNRMSELGGAGVVLNAGATICTIEQNDFSNGTGQSNWNAGVLVTDRDVDFASNPQAIFDAGGYWPVFSPIRGRLNPPHDNLIAFNHIANNRTSGIYMDGSVRNVIFSNTIQGNAKEGLCLDNGATSNVVASNVIQQNGKRWGQTDATLQLDFVAGRLPDGSAASKLPGVSIDNGIYNILFGNNISHNFGGGVKMVRTAFFNVIGMNKIESDNDGVSVYYRFFGVELGAAPGDAASAELDFTGSRGNVLFSNSIRGSNSSGIFIQLGSDTNQILDNVIMDSTLWAIESVLSMANTLGSNLTDRPSQNVGADCCAIAARLAPDRLSRRP